MHVASLWIETFAHENAYNFFKKDQNMYSFFVHQKPTHKKRTNLQTKKQEFKDETKMLKHMKCFCWPKLSSWTTTLAHGKTRSPTC